MTRKSDFIALVILASVSVLPWFRLGLTGNGVWTFWDNIFNFYPLSAFWDSLSAINSVYSNFGVQNMGVLGGFPVYGFQYLGSMLGLSVVAQSRLTYMLPWMLRGTGMFILLSAIDRHDSKYSLFAKLGASVLYQFAPSGDPISNNLVSVVTGVEPIALAIFVKVINSSKRYRYAILFSVWFGLAAISAYALVFISVLVILYALLASLRTGKIRHNVTFLVLCLALSLLSISYVFIPYAYSQVYHASSILGGNQLGLTTSGLQDKFQGILQFSTKNGPEYGLLGLENGIWQWFPLYTQVIVILSLALTAILAYFFLLLKRDSNMLFFAIVGITGVALATTVTLPLFGSVYLFGFHYFYPLFVDPTYFLYFIWFGVCGLVGLGGSKLLSLMSQQRRGVMPIMAVLLIGIIAVDSYPMAVAAPAP